MMKKQPSKKQPPPQLLQQEQQSDEAQPLIQQVDPTYEPTMKEIRQYALQILGMKLPEDQNLLYLARQGLKAPIPTNWVPYQSINGQIYYKHNITQQKTFEHPTDTQYRKKYEQIKEKAVRKNLKSISLKQNMGMQGLMPNSSMNSLGINNNSGLGGNISNFSGEDAIQITIDEEALEQYDRDLKQYQKKQQKQWRKFEQQCQQEHNRRMKVLKLEEQQQRNRLQGKTSGSRKSQSKIIEQQKSRLQKSLQQGQQLVLKQELRILEKQQQNKLSQYKTVYEEDNNIKLMKIEQQMQNNYQQKVKIFEDKLVKIQQKKKKDKELRLQALKQARDQLQKPDNSQITALLAKTMDDNLREIKGQYEVKIKQRQEQLEHQLTEMKKLLGIDQTQNLLSLASKKQRLLEISKQKVAAKKQKQLQIIELQTQKQLQSQIYILRQKLEKQNDQKIQQKKKQLQQKYQKSRIQIQANFINKIEKQVQQMYQAASLDKNNFQATMNKKLSDMRMKYINKLQDLGRQKAKGKQQTVVNRVVISEKESQVQNKEQLIKNLERQLQLQRIQWKLTKLQQQISKILNRSSNDNNKQLTNVLKQKLKSLSIKFQPPQLIKSIDNYRQLQDKYKQDKKLLGRILRALQQTSAYNVYQMRKNPIDGDLNSGGSGAMIKKYNQDVRKMRENQENLTQYQVLIKKTELGGSQFEQNLQKLKQFGRNFQYKQIGLKSQLQANDYRKTNVFNINPQNKKVNEGIDQISQILPKQKQKAKSSLTTPTWGIGINSGGSTSYPNLYTTSNYGMQQTLRQHSRFLSSVKNQLNKKLYQVRYDYRH